MNKRLNLKSVKVGRARVVITSLLTFLMVALMVFTLLLQVKFDITQFNWFEFTFSIINFVAGRGIYFPMGLDVGMANPDYMLIANTLKKYRNLIIKKRVNKEFRERLKVHNQLSKCEAYLDILDNQLLSKKITDSEVLTIEAQKSDVLAYIDFLNGKVPEYKGTLNLATLRVKYDYTTFDNMFAFGTGNRKVGSKYISHPYTTGLKFSAMPFIMTIIIAFANAVMVFGEYGVNTASILVFVIKLIMFAWGCYQGIQTGKRVVDEDKYPTILNLMSLGKEIITEIEIANNIVIDEAPLPKPLNEDTPKPEITEL